MDMLQKIETNSYLVGGSVRDRLLGLESKDLDYVVEGTTEDEMITAGFTKVGSHHPTFLHPKTKAEYSLLRGKNSKTVYDDLAHRDLTINAIAMDSKGHLIDPFNGQKDLENKVLRAPSESFIDDPLRVFRVARFKTLMPSFKLSEDLICLMKKAISLPEFIQIPGERILKEMRKAFQAEAPEMFFHCLNDAQCLKETFPEVHHLIGIPQPLKYHPEGDCYNHTMLVLNAARSFTNKFEVIFGALTHDFGKGITPQDILPSHRGHESFGIPLVEKFCERLKVCGYTKSLALFACENHLKCHRIFEMRPRKIAQLLQRADFKRRPEFLKDFLLICASDNKGKLDESEYRPAVFLKECQEVLSQLKPSECIDSPINAHKLLDLYSDAVAKVKQRY